jgi:hypothetical protein
VSEHLSVLLVVFQAQTIPKTPPRANFTLGHWLHAKLGIAWMTFMAKDHSTVHPDQEISAIRFYPAARLEALPLLPGRGDRPPPYLLSRIWFSL